jgi:hypothetical protein
MQGNLVPVTSLVSLPFAVTDLLLRLFGQSRVQPWIPYRATRELARIIRKDWHVLEFGAGMSTVWFAQRSAFVLSIESNEVWYRRVAAMLVQRDLHNVDLRLRPDQLGYLAVDGSFDLVVIDGEWRDRCVDVALTHVRDHGFLYLDNVDAAARTARATLMAGLPIESVANCYTDFAPGLAAPTTGLLVQRP